MQRPPDTLDHVLKGLEPDLAHLVADMPFRSVMIPRGWTPRCDEPPEVEAVVVIDGELTPPVLAELIEAVDLAEERHRALILVSTDKHLRDAAKRRLTEAMAARKGPGGRA